jgi:hypothetical protein
VTTHAIGDEKKGRPRVAGVLVALSYQTYVGASCIAKVEGHGGYF